MKALTMAIVLGIFTIGAQAQETNNKPGKGSFGVSYNIVLNNGVQNAVYFSGYTSKKIEIGSGVTFNYTREHSPQQTTPVTVTGADGTLLSAVIEDVSNTNRGFLGVTPFIRYHFSIPGNADIYTGIAVPFSASVINSQVVTSELKATDYEVRSKNKLSGPVALTTGANMLLGCRYFVSPQWAIGAEAGIGFNANFVKGKRKMEYTVTNSGSNNNNTDNSFSSESDVTTGANYSMGLLTSAGINLSWYFGKKKGV